MDAYSFTRQQRPQNPPVAPLNQTMVTHYKRHRPVSLPPAPPSSISNNAGSLRLPSSRPNSLVAGRVTTPGIGSSWGEVTGLPTRMHWKPNGKADRCSFIACQKSFTLFERRHHCRSCGDIYCAACSNHLLPLDQDAEYHPEGVMSRVCDGCMKNAQRRVAATTAEICNANGSGWSSPVDIASDAESSVTAITASDSPVMAPEKTEKTPSHNTLDIGSKSISIGIDRHNNDSALNLVSSVPHDWIWSTF